MTTLGRGGIFAVDGGEFCAVRHGRFTFKERVSDTHRREGSMSPRVSLDAVLQKNLSPPARMFCCLKLNLQGGSICYAFCEICVLVEVQFVTDQSYLVLLIPLLFIHEYNDMTNSITIR
jgi:hypothetical protein